MKEYQYQLRAHHGMCISFFKGEGYSNEFTKHMAQIVQNLSNNPLICISDATDILCQKCPHNQNGICETADKVASYDKQLLAECDLKPGMILPFSDFQSTVYNRIIRTGKREQICGDCEWTSICHLEPSDQSK